MSSIKFVAGKTTVPPLCKNCRYFRLEQNISTSRCLKYGSLNLVTGEIKYEYADIAREYECKGNSFDPIPPPPPPPPDKK